MAVADVCPCLLWCLQGGAYDRNMDCVLTLTAPDNFAVSLLFNDFQTEDCCDFVGM